MEAKQQHTPGPWIVRQFPSGSYGRRQLWVTDSIPDQNGKVIANAICLVSSSNPNEEANAILLAAAPDLLEACKAANKYLADMAMNGGPKQGTAGIVEWSEVQASLSAAIAKATKV